MKRKRKTQTPKGSTEAADIPGFDPLNDAYRAWSEVYQRAIPYRDERSMNSKFTLRGVPLPDRLTLHSILKGKRKAMSKGALNAIDGDAHRLQKEAGDGLRRWRELVQNKPPEHRVGGYLDGFALDCVMQERYEKKIHFPPWEEADCERCLKRFHDFRKAAQQFLTFAERELHTTPSKSGAIAVRKRKYRRTPERDCWLLLIWPIVEEYRWTHTDIAIALRCQFWENPKDIEFGSPEAREWEERLRHVMRADRDAVRKRCKRLGLRVSAASHRPKGKRTDFPPMMQLALLVQP
jgi:hypothetical protein